MESVRHCFPLGILLLLIIFSAGCARPPLPAAVPPPVAFDNAKLKERSEFWHDYETKLRFNVESKASKFSSRAIILIKGRDFARFETFSPFGQTAALYISNETGPSLLIPSEKVIFTAQRAETLIHQFLGITMPADVLRYALTASVPPEQLAHAESRVEAGEVHLISSSGGKFFDWQISAGSPALKGIFIRSDEFEGRVSYDPPVVLANEAIPKKIRISSTEWNMEIEVTELKPVSQFKPASFIMPDLPDVRRVALENLK